MSTAQTVDSGESNRRELLIRLSDVHEQWRALADEAATLTAALVQIEIKAIDPKQEEDGQSASEVPHRLDALVGDLVDPLTAAHAFIHTIRRLAKATDRSNQMEVDRRLAQALDQIARASEVARQLRKAVATIPVRPETTPRD